jgi:antirestriction protein
MDYTTLVGETGAMSSGEMFMYGGRLTTNRELLEAFLDSKKELKVGNLTTHYSTLGDVIILRNYGTIIATRQGKKVSINSKKYSNTTTTITNLLEKLANEREMKIMKISDDKFMSGGRTNERKHVNKSEDYEVRYAKPRPNRKGYLGKRNFDGGGGVGDESPKIYVADLEAYNNGKLSGVWLDLMDYDDADELMGAIQDFLKTTGGGEYAIHDVENIPSRMYSEYMGQRDFEELYEMIDLAKDNDLPLEVVFQVVSQYSPSAVDEFVGKYDSADDFAQELVDDTGIQSFIDFERYLIVSDTDRRLLAQEMADNYVDDIKDEDGGNRLIEEAGLDVDEYEEADSDRQEEMLDEAREIVYDEYYDTWYDGLSDPYNFLVEEQGLYSAEDFANANFVQIDYEALADALGYDYAFIYKDGDLYRYHNS